MMKSISNYAPLTRERSGYPTVLENRERRELPEVATNIFRKLLALQYPELACPFCHGIGGHRYGCPYMDLR